MNSFQSTGPATLDAFMTKYEIPLDYKAAINELQGRDVVFIADNSGSMSRSLQSGGSMTRWEKLGYFARMICDFSPLVDRGGYDLCFLNPLQSGRYAGKYYIEKVTAQSDVEECFKGEPGGLTPLIRRINEVINKYRGGLGEKELLLYIATDGLNSDESGNETPGAIKKWVKETFAQDKLLREKVTLNFMLLSDEQNVIDEYSIADEAKGPKGEKLSIDVVSPKHIEKEQFEKANPGKKYTDGTEIAKMLIGGASAALDASDEREVEFTLNGNVDTSQPVSGGCCVIS